MPELPEVETVVRSLRPYLVGKKIRQVEIRREKSFPDQELLPVILDQEIMAIRRRAKLIIIDLANHYHLVAHLKMTGQLLYKGENLAGGGHPTADILQQLPGKHTRVIVDLSDRAQLFFNDLRVFGWLRIMDQETLVQSLSAYGPDAHQISDVVALHAAFARRRLPIKQVLMDNHIAAGIGNIYAAEILFACHLDPRRPAQSLTLAQTEDICRAARTILTQAIAAGGTTFDGRYVDADGRGGNFEEKLQVYGRAGEPCLVCGATLLSVKLGGRSTVYCPDCQK